MNRLFWSTPPGVREPVRYRPPAPKPEPGPGQSLVKIAAAGVKYNSPRLRPHRSLPIRAAANRAW